MMTALLLSLTQNKFLILMMINVILLILGCPMDMAPMIMIMTSILLPVVVNPAIGMDPVHLGVLLIQNSPIGQITPPVGTTLFVGCAIGKTTIGKISLAQWQCLLSC